MRYSGGVVPFDTEGVVLYGVPITVETARRPCNHKIFRALSSQRVQILLGADSFLILPPSIL